jgi:hypothetical protein
MAAYALGLMQQHFEQEWDTHLLFCDQRQVVTHHWTYATASELVRTVLANVGTPPKENDYCGWCAKSLTCGARVKSMTGALVPVQSEITPDNDGFLTLLKDAGHIAHAVQLGQIGATDAILAGGALSAKKAEALWSAAGAVMPESIVARKIGQQPLVQAK